MSFRARYKSVACVGLHDKVEPTALSDVLYRLGQLLVPVERKGSRGTVRIERGVGTYVIGHEFHRRRYENEKKIWPEFRRGTGKRLGFAAEIGIKNSRRSVDSMQDSSWKPWEVEEVTERKAARASDTIPVPAPIYRVQTVSCRRGPKTLKKEKKRQKRGYGSVPNSMM